MTIAKRIEKFLMRETPRRWSFVTIAFTVYGLYDIAKGFITLDLEFVIIGNLAITFALFWEIRRMKKE